MSILWPLGGVVAGAMAGSFIATLCLRWPRGEQAMSGRSICDGCQRPLGPAELVPVISALILRGRCRTCGAAIPRFHLQVELIAACLGGVALALEPNFRGAALALFWLLLLPSALLDARHYWLPDRLTLAIAAGGMALGGLVSGAALADRLIGGGVGFAALWLIAQAYRRARGREGLGSGDPKLFGAIGLWTGWSALAPILLVASLLGLAVALLMRRSALDRMPFGTLLAAAGIIYTAAMAAGFGLSSTAIAAGGR